MSLIVDDCPSLAATAYFRDVGKMQECSSHEALS